MSNRRKAQAIQALDAMCDQLPIPGGCLDCNAEQTMTRDSNGVYRITIHHEDTCPWLAGIERRKGETTC
ncbi:hypothetical protein EDD41_0412 [Luteococcus japonicus]|uniref:Uncharacterized protein n=1 Tax=Luteococcus japonicus TaxID=33984 RepID=A0A3N1ZSE2_9ACTN|nr:hypothetical protein [Luteococcus japonicus]ROR53277.1 hypothetical protein EDD41_0412 [Luteococcus japonicus]